MQQLDPLPGRGIDQFGQCSYLPTNPVVQAGLMSHSDEDETIFAFEEPVREPRCRIETLAEECGVSWLKPRQVQKVLVCAAAFRVELNQPIVVSQEGEDLGQKLAHLLAAPECGVPHLEGQMKAAISLLVVLSFPTLHQPVHDMDAGGDAEQIEASRRRHL